MKIKRKETYESEIIEAVICDICKKKYKGQRWGAGEFETEETVISYRYGTSYPESANGQKIAFDVCPNCFKERLIPALRELGAEPTVTDWGW